jgi:NDP-sugar pyrophosphorylase family protein/thiamine kinase-like enzyme
MAAFDTVFITTSGLGTRLEGLTQYTNKALVPIGDQYAICRIIERFQESTRFVVTLGYYGTHVRDFLELAYPRRQFVFVEVDRYEGPGSSQAYSMLYAAEHLTTPFLYHCCDTILPPISTLHAPNKDVPVTLYVAPHADYTTYSGITVRDDHLVRFNRKKEAIHDYVYIGISYVADPAAFWAALRASCSGRSEETAAADTDAYRLLLSQGRALDYRVLPTFYDTGNMDSYRHACRAFPASATVLAKPNESLCFLKDQQKVIKFLHSAAANAKRVQRGHMLESCGGPKILGAKPNFMAMAYEEGMVLAECREWGTVRRLLEWANTHLWTGAHANPDYQHVCRRFYYEKTLKRLAEYKAKHPEDSTRVNGVDVGSIGDLLDRVDWSELCTDRFTRYHGDFIMDNILQRKDGSFVLLDWRECFDTEVEFGDPAYDLAKLRHNLVFNHANIARGEYSVTREGDQVFVDLGCKYLLVRQLEELDNWIKEHAEWNVRNIRILQALIWLNMAPLYEAPLSDFLYYFGKWNIALALMA